jgi:NADH:ubiquinone oxidoreductase subunit 3 (subunit A)
LIIAPIVVTYKNLGLAGWVIVLVLIGVLVWAIRQSKKPTPAIGDTPA